MTPESAAPPPPPARSLRRVSRREALAGVGAVSLATLLAACGDDDAGRASGTAATEVTTTEGPATVTPRAPANGRARDLLDDGSACTLAPEQTEGPFYFDADAIRSDVREDRDGAELRLAIRIRDEQTCTPLKDAVVEIWHCDAAGLYSGFEDGTAAGPGRPAGSSDDERYLRGAQVTDDDGIAGFTTVYPGWYPGRTVHIHAKVHLRRTSLLTTQLYFDDALSDAVFEGAPYTARPGRDVRNGDDGFFSAELVMRAARDAEVVLGAISFDVRSA